MGCRGMERLALRRLSGKPMARLDLIFKVFLLRVPNAGACDQGQASCKLLKTLYEPLPRWPLSSAKYFSTGILELPLK